MTWKEAQKTQSWSSSGGKGSQKGSSEKSRSWRGASGQQGQHTWPRPHNGSRATGHNGVPKNVNLNLAAKNAERDPESRTTVMVRNIPKQYYQSDLLNELDQAGFDDKYDFLYLPMDTHNQTNVGYAFINFVTPAYMNEFITAFSGYRFKGNSNHKVATVALAHLQGFFENVQHFSNRAVTHSRNSQYRPIVIIGGQRMDLNSAAESIMAARCQLNMDTYASAFASLEREAGVSNDADRSGWTTPPWPVKAHASNMHHVLSPASIDESNLSTPVLSAPPGLVLDYATPQASTETGTETDDEDDAEEVEDDEGLLQSSDATDSPTDGFEPEPDLEPLDEQEPFSSSFSFSIDKSGLEDALSQWLKFRSEAASAEAAAANMGWSLDSCMAS